MDEKKILNELLMKNFKDILKIEEMALGKNPVTEKLTMQEIHTIECIGDGEYSLLSEIAEELKITLGTLSVMVAKLFAKGFITKEKDPKDKRVMKVALTEKGRSVYEVHEKFHNEFVNYITEYMDEEEVESILVFLDRINKFFINKYSDVIEDEVIEDEEE